ncbi:endoplasmic reticulum membrane-associated RNA degradation protein-like [Biomphalaria glabrata]|uniref:Endoplasmic reticulum membrane-associated RNA degradation protein-like n=1 Tax=Biomphalaria glabrata TaxID=6526 RepID=A0A9W2ZWV2_BIOGL|nr:endoplasmic reticulum membrane-associated RNA degradation protein-like [Biomphalaria glabrata]
MSFNSDNNEIEIVASLLRQFNNNSQSFLSEGVKRLICHVHDVGSIADDAYSKHSDDITVSNSSLTSTPPIQPFIASPYFEHECSLKECDSEETEESKLLFHLDLLLGLQDNLIKTKTAFIICKNGYIHFRPPHTNENITLRSSPRSTSQIKDESNIDISLHYKNSVQCMTQAFRFSEVVLEHFDTTTFTVKFSRFLDWTKNVKLFQDCFELLSHHDGADDLLALLMLCGGLEKALGNLYLTKGMKCPAMLKDLLATTELRDILGDSVIAVLHVVMGPPVSMNLRNVAWHGFLSVNELPRRYIYFLLLLTVSIGKHLSERHFSTDVVENRLHVSLSACDDIAQHLKVELSDVHLQQIEELIESSWIVTKGNKEMIKSGFTYYSLKNYSWSALCLLPQLECTLRRLFVVVNKCPERLLTAEATSLYTTFEEILDLYLPDGSLNALIQVCGESFMDLLHDLLIYPKGPRARDKLSHGEADYLTVQQSLCCIVISCLFYLALKFTPHGMASPVEGYRSIFHPVSILKHKIIELSSLATGIYLELCQYSDTKPCKHLELIQASLKRFVQSESLSSLSSRLPDWNMLLEMSAVPFENSDGRIQFVLNLLRHNTLHRWHPSKSTPAMGSTKKVSESEIVNLCSRVLQETEASLRQISSTLRLRLRQLQDKQLRSRQRDNLDSLKAFLPCMSLMSNYVLILSTWIVCHLNSYDSLDDSAQKLLQRFLKNCLQTCENLRTYTSAENCKWSVSGEIILKEINLAELFAEQNIFGHGNLL